MKYLSILNGLAIFAFLTLVVFNGCNTVEVEQFSSTSSSASKWGKTSWEVDTARHRVGKALARSMNNSQQVREFIDSMAREKTAGEFSTLFMVVKDHEIEGSNTFSDILSVNSMWSTSYFSDSIEFIDPTMSIQVYYPNEDSTGWNTANHSPDVAIQGDQQDDSTMTIAKAYDASGSMFNLGEDYPRSNVAIALKESERIIAIDKSTGEAWSGWTLNSLLGGDDELEDCVDACLEVYYESTATKLVKLENLLQCMEDCREEHSGGGNPGSGCDRDLTQYEDSKEELVKWRFESFEDEQFALGALGWLFEGKVEMRALFTFHEGGANDGSWKTDKLFVHKRSVYHCSGGSCPWIYENLTTIDFDEDEHGDKYKITWIEQDKKDFSIDLEVSFEVEVPIGSNNQTATAGTSATFKYSPADERMGSAYVSYCDNADVNGEDYTTGSVEFNARVEQ